MYKQTVNASPRWRPRRFVLAAAMTASLTIAAASTAVAADPTGDYAEFNHCPLDDAVIQSCVYAEQDSGSFQLGNSTVPITKTITLQGGFNRDRSEPTGFRFVDAVGTDTLSKTPLDVPGGLTGITIPSQITSIPVLGPLFTAAVNSVNGVTATAELVGPVGFNFTNFITGRGPTAILPVRIKLDNPFLGNNCYIGSANDPVTLRLGTGTTDPPAPNSPISGSPGTITQSNAGQLTSVTGFTLVDNAFAVPAAHHCGPLGFQWAVTPIVNLKEGLPAAAGRNTAVLSGDNMKAAGATAVRDSIPGQ